MLAITNYKVKTGDDIPTFFLLKQFLESIDSYTNNDFPYSVTNMFAA